jgi:signal recognition particle GTPase
MNVVFAFFNSFSTIKIQIPAKYIGVGEGIEDLQVFNKYEFVDSFFN